MQGHFKNEKFMRLSIIRAKLRLRLKLLLSQEKRLNKLMNKDDIAGVC
jgi:hypothetical protein